MHRLDNMSCDDVRSFAKEIYTLNKELIAEIERETRLDYAWAGNLGRWYLNFTTGHVVFNPLKIQAIGYTRDELPDSVHYNFFTDKVHPDDHEPMMQAMRDAMTGKSPVYECEYRIQAKDGSWKWFYDRGKVTQRDNQGAPVLAAGIVFDITDKKQREQELTSELNQAQEQALIDALTNVRNRRAILEELSARLDQAKQTQMPLSIAMIDIDHFKQVNDTHGHLVGDQVIRTVAQTLAAAIRGLDSVGRYGGEEFLVILPNTPLKYASEVFERMRQRVEASSIIEGESVTVSIGVADYRGGPIEEFIQQADECLYAAKHGGRNRVVSLR